MTGWKRAGDPPPKHRDIRVPPWEWANDSMGGIMRQEPHRAVRDELLQQLMRGGLEALDLKALRWLLKFVLAHELNRIKTEPEIRLQLEFDAPRPTTPAAALDLLGLTMPGPSGRTLLRRWAVDMALARPRGRRRLHRKLGDFIEGVWEGWMPDREEGFDW